MEDVENIGDDTLIDRLRAYAENMAPSGQRALMLRAAKRIDDIHTHMDAQDRWTRAVEDENKRLKARNAHLEGLLAKEQP